MCHADQRKKGNCQGELDYQQSNKDLGYTPFVGEHEPPHTGDIMSTLAARFSGAKISAACRLGRFEDGASFWDNARYVGAVRGCLPLCHAVAKVHLTSESMNEKIGVQSRIKASITKAIARTHARPVVAHHAGWRTAVHVTSRVTAQPMRSRGLPPSLTNQCGE